MLRNLALEPVETPLAVPDYPWMLVHPLELADGAALRLRPIRPDDEPRLMELFHRLSPRTVYQRFFRAYDRLPDHWYQRFANVDYRTRLALVAEEQGKLVGLAHCVRHRGTWNIGDMCYLEDLFVAPSARGKGVGRALIEAVYARAARGQLPGAVRVGRTLRFRRAQVLGLLAEGRALSPRGSRR